ncbi:aminomethyltransferase family protein [Cryptosporangium aurantiacum]|uniref:Aminomethyltransferase n=1 Tax=Cryptosporangium aurantiacum TaxID=134849 RepID=A0A1M7QAN2_9ACTN|nr:aminomethyltransferase family protein [Cryptosporangium aurantiacum]SHN27679.1 aminomethyltransferase [Cryptosporangium aurantiacum]
MTALTVPAVWADVDGTPVPAHYGDPDAEYGAIRRAAARFDLTAAGLLELTGDDAFDLLQAALARDLEFVTPEQSLLTAILDEDGRPVDLVTVYLTDDGYRLETSLGRTSTTLAHLEKLRADGHGASATITDLRGIETIVLVEGLTAAEVVERAIDPDLGTLPFGGTTVVPWNGGELAVSRTGFTGEYGYKFFVRVEDAPALWEALDAAVPAGLVALETAMLEVRQPCLHRETVDAATALQAGFNWLIDVTKENFTGRDAVAAEFETGPTALPIGWSLPGTDVPEVGAEVRIGGETVGQVIWALRSPSRGDVLGLARIRAELSAAGLDVVIDGRTGRTLAAPYVIPSSWATASETAILDAAQAEG